MAAPVQDYEELVNDPQVIANAYIQEVERPGHGPVPMVGAPVKFSRTPGEIRRLAPALGEHTHEVLLECGLTQEELDGIHAAIAKARAPDDGGEDRLGPAIERARARFMEAMDDDFDTRKAFQVVFELTTAVGEVPRVTRSEAGGLLEFYRDVSRVLGILDDASL